MDEQKDVYPGNFEIDEPLNEVKQEFENLYKQLVDEISASQFDSIWPILEKEEISFNKEKLLKVFKEKLQTRILNDFQQTWEVSNISESLSILEILKKHPKTTNKQWRPTGKSVEEQLRPYIIKAVKSKIVFFEKQIQYQQSHLDILKKIVDDKRADLRKTISDREDLSCGIDKTLIEIDEIRLQIKNYRLRIFHYSKSLYE